MTTQQHRVKHGRPPQRSAHWHDKAKAFARERKIEVRGVLDLHDHLADLLEWEGATRADSEHRAWEQTVAIFERRAA